MKASFTFHKPEDDEPETEDIRLIEQPVDTTAQAGITPISKLDVHQFSSQAEH